MTNMDKQLADLWREWFRDEGSPRVDGEAWDYCFFCGGNIHWKDGKSIECHLGWCVFKRVKDLLQGETK